MSPTETRQRIWRSAFWFAFTGPPIGLAITIAFLLAAMIASPSASDTPEEIFLMFDVIPVGLIAAYIAGGPAAFVVGASTQIMRDHGLKTLWILAANLVLGAAASTFTSIPVDHFFFGHPYSNLPYGVGVLGAITAAICTLLTARRKRDAAAADATARPSP